MFSSSGRRLSMSLHSSQVSNHTHTHAYIEGGGGCAWGEAARGAALHFKSQWKEGKRRRAARLDSQKQFHLH